MYNRLNASEITDGLNEITYAISQLKIKLMLVPQVVTLTYPSIYNCLKLVEALRVPPLCGNYD